MGVGCWVSGEKKEKKEKAKNKTVAHQQINSADKRATD